MTLQTERLLLRELTQDDYPALCRILQDADVMYAYEHAFSEQETQGWLDNQLRRYREDGFGLWAVVLRQTGEMIGQCGITWQTHQAARVPEIGYLFQKAAWHQGFATEAARACKQYAFETLGFDAVYAIMRENNQASRSVAARCGMKPVGTQCKHYYSMDMPHIVYAAQRGCQ